MPGKRICDPADGYELGRVSFWEGNRAGDPIRSARDRGFQIGGLRRPAMRHSHNSVHKVVEPHGQTRFLPIRIER